MKTRLGLFFGNDKDSRRTRTSMLTSGMYGNLMAALLASAMLINKAVRPESAEANLLSPVELSIWMSIAAAEFYFADRNVNPHDQFGFAWEIIKDLSLIVAGAAVEKYSDYHAVALGLIIAGVSALAGKSMGWLLHQFETIEESLLPEKKVAPASLKAGSGK